MLNVLFRQECNSILWDFFPPSGCNRKRKLISQSKKELENFIGAKFGDSLAAYSLSMLDTDIDYYLSTDMDSRLREIFC